MNSPKDCKIQEIGGVSTKRFCSNTMALMVV
jgi:hypothetical protein